MAVATLVTAPPSAETSSPARTRVESRTLAEAIRLRRPSRSWLLDGFMTERSVGIMWGWRGCGKTWVSMSAAWAVATGGEFLRFKAPRPFGVLYVDGEMDEEDIVDRFEQIRDSAGGDPGELLRILAADWTEEGIPSIATPEGRDKIDVELAEMDDPRLVVVDNVSTLCMSPMSENDERSWYEIQEWALRLKRQRGISTLFVHHAGKNEEQRGSSKREDVASVVVALLERGRDEEDGVILEWRFRKSRGLYGRKQPMRIELLQGEGGRLRWDWKTQEKSTAAKVKKLVASGMSQADAARKLGVKPSTVSRHVNKGKGKPRRAKPSA